MYLTLDDSKVITEGNGQDWSPVWHRMQNNVSRLAPRQLSFWENKVWRSDTGQVLGAGINLNTLPLAQSINTSIQCRGLEENRVVVFLNSQTRLTSVSGNVCFNAEVQSRGEWWNHYQSVVFLFFMSWDHRQPPHIHFVLRGASQLPNRGHGLNSGVRRCWEFLNTGALLCDPR